MIAAYAYRTFVVWLESAQKITFPVGEKYFSNWKTILNYELGIMNYEFRVELNWTELKTELN